jgi:hypothetical protein
MNKDAIRNDRAAIIPNWPELYGRGQAVPKDLSGAIIMAIGTLDFTGKRPEGGGLVIDYRPKGSSDIKRITLAFTEGGMWEHPFPNRDDD